MPYLFSAALTDFPYNRIRIVFYSYIENRKTIRNILFSGDGDSCYCLSTSHDINNKAFELDLEQSVFYKSSRIRKKRLIRIVIGTKRIALNP